MEASVDFTIAFDNPDEAAGLSRAFSRRPGLSQVRTREEARENVLNTLRTILTPDEELVGETANSNREHLRFTAAA